TRASLDAARATAASLRRRQIALQEELDWQVYSLYGLLEPGVDLTFASADSSDSADSSNPAASLDSVPEVALGERAFEIVLARAMAAGEVETKWFERHGSTPVTEVPARWPAAYRDLVERRIQAIATNPNIALIEKPEYKRRWAQEPWEEMEARALRSWLLDRLEEPRCWPVDAQGAPSLQSAVHLCDRVRHDEEFRRVAELNAGRPDVDLEKLVADLALEEAVPYLAAFRYTDDGLRKRAVWERTWDLQRREDAGETLDIPVPPKYAREDFRKGSYWSLRGKLDVPKERFVHYPDASRAADPSPVLGWAGWDHLQRARALAAYYLRMKTDEGWPPERLVPLLAGLAELLPWLRQWHDDLDPATGERLGTWFAAFVADEARELGTTVEALGAWRPAATSARRRAKGTK
ncbi:MAG TPA: BREX-2 system adenine-specific DNA-methyltransferase PglX, partial [Thermoanaerobaculia bacterium]|nr:BREX-2 system adenine-specific DNA-methyltransferase PglX [Thermoanaerobaculia bacterium]